MSDCSEARQQFKESEYDKKYDMPKLNGQGDKDRGTCYKPKIQLIFDVLFMILAAAVIFCRNKPFMKKPFMKEYLT